MERVIESVINGLLNGPLSLKIIAFLVALIYAMIVGLRFVKEAELGLKLRFGKVVRDRNRVPKVIHPGFTILLPHVDTLIRHPVKQQTITLPGQEIILKDNSIWDVSGVLIYKIHDIYKALFEITGLEPSLRNVSMGKLRSVLQKLEGVEQIKDIEAVEKALMAEMEKEGKEWGVDILSFHLVNCSPNPATAGFITAKASVKARNDALKEAGVTDPMLAAALLGIPSVTAIGQHDFDKEAVVVRTELEGSSDAIRRIT